jgi:MAX-like protein X
LPETGVPSVSNDMNTNRNELLRQKFKSYVLARTVENYKFQIFSTILNPLFENYLNNVKKPSREELFNWQNEYLSLANLRSRKS